MSKLYLLHVKASSGLVRRKKKEKHIISLWNVEDEEDGIKLKESSKQQAQVPENGTEVEHLIKCTGRFGCLDVKSILASET